jgi:DNA processing protein
LNQAQFENIARLKILLAIDRIGHARIFNLLTHFSSLDEVFNADLDKLKSVDLINSSLAQRIQKSGNNFDRAKQNLEIELEKLQKINASLITFWDEEYPQNLKRIYSPPTILYSLGSSSVSDLNSLSIVGTRKSTNYGRSFTNEISKELAAREITVVSGLARGIDSVAHKSTLVNGGNTIAIIGSGLDIIYPPENKRLFDEICDKGKIFTEFELGTKPDAQNFPRRNRIISGISKGTLVIETKLNGGAMQTARLALEQNREVFALPGRVDAIYSEGTNYLIKNGEAKLISNVEDILDEIHFKNVVKKESKSVNRIDTNLFEQKIIELLSAKPKHIDSIIRESPYSQSECLSHLLNLELKGLVHQHPGKTFTVV